MALLGVLSRHLKIDAATWLEAIRRNMKPELYEVNRQAFEIGRNGAQGARCTYGDIRVLPAGQEGWTVCVHARHPTCCRVDIPPVGR